MSKRKAVIAGAGRWAREWGRTVATSEGATIAGWVDVQAGFAADAVRELGVEAVTGTDFVQVMEGAQPDFLVNATVPAAHAKVTVSALQWGVPVLCEKPMATTLEEAGRMIRASEQSGKLLMISQQRSRDPRVVAMKKLIEEHIGRLGILQAEFFLSNTEPAYSPGMRSALLVDMSVHTFDAARYLSGTDPVTVYCDDFHPYWSRHKTTAAAMAIFQMEGGLRFCYDGSWVVRGYPTTWECEWRAMGEHGTALWDGVGTPEADIVESLEPGRQPLEHVVATIDQSAPTWLSASLIAFLHALDTCETPMGECHDNVKTLAMVLGAVESASTGRRVDIREMLKAVQSWPVKHERSTNCVKGR